VDSEVDHISASSTHGVCGMDVAGGRSLLRELLAAFKGLIFSRYYCIYYGKLQVRHRLVVDLCFRMPRCGMCAQQIAAGVLTSETTS
jgi:hypothetical protein